MLRFRASTVRVPTATPFANFPKPLALAARGATLLLSIAAELS